MDNIIKKDVLDERDGLKDLIYAKFGTARQIREHLFPSTKFEVDDEKVEKFISKYTEWLGTKIK